VTALSLGAVTGSLLSVPLYQASGGSVRLVLGWIALPAALATLLWLPQARHTIRPVVPVRASGVAVYRYALAWQVTAFMGLQSLLYFATLSWLPTILRDRGTTPETAGNLLALRGLGNLAAALLVPVVAQRLNGQRVLAVSAAAGLAAGLAGALYTPLGSAVAWVLILGVSQGAALALAIFFTIARAPDPVSAASLSSLAQAVGYLVASAGPLELGLLHSATGSWDLPVAVLFVLNGCRRRHAGRPIRVLPDGRNAPSAVIRRIPGRPGCAQDGGSPSRRTAREVTRALRIPTEAAIMVIFDNPATVPAPAGQYSHVARAELGDRTILQLSGQAAIDADGNIVGGNDMAAQADYIMDNITAILAAHGATLADVVNIRAYLTDMSQLPEYGKVRAARFTGTPPTVTTVEVSRLFVPGALLEVEVLAIA
jgi:enamine deaminase RidA (YjgF/YER057c/UK114 family)